MSGYLFGPVLRGGGPRLRQGRSIRPGESSEEAPDFLGCVNDGCPGPHEPFGKERGATRPAVSSTGEAQQKNLAALSAWPVYEALRGMGGFSGARSAVQGLSDLRLGWTPIVLNPPADRFSNTWVEDASPGQRKRRAQSAFVERPRIVNAMNVQDWNWAAWVRRSDYHTTSDWSDGRDPLGHLDGQPVGHHRPVGVAGDIYPRSINRRPACEVTQQHLYVPNVVYPLISCIAAAGPGIPRQELPAQATRARWEYCDETLSIRDPIKPRVPAHLFRVAPASVKGQDQRHLTPATAAGWNVDEVISLPPAVLNLELRVARSQGCLGPFRASDSSRTRLRLRARCRHAGDARKCQEEERHFDGAAEETPEHFRPVAIATNYDTP